MGKETLASRDSTLKKPKKKSALTAETNKPDEDVYKKLIQFEENEAMKRTPEQDANLYFQTCKNIRKILNEITELKNSSLPDAAAKISEKRVEASMLVTILKKLNRLEKFRTKFGRDALHQAKLQADSTKLQLQNLLYELTYLKKEIAKCFQFRSLDEEIDLISKQEFYKTAPQTIAKPEKTKKNPHQLQLARLEWELEQRKQLASECQNLETEKSKVAQEIVDKQELLEKLAPQLHRVLEVMKPLQEQLGMTGDKVREEHQLAYLLPDSLYLLYAKVDAYTHVYDKTTKVHILGEEDEAKQLKKDDDESQDTTVESDSDQEASEEILARQKRHNRKSSRTAEPQDEKRNKLLASHPLNVRIEINFGKEKGPTLIVDFFYKLKLHVVTVKCEVTTPKPIVGIAAAELMSPVNILRELFPSDTGENSPNSTNHYQLQQLQLGSFSSLVEKLGYAYIWAQKICGLDFIASKLCGNNLPTPNSELSQSTVENVMKLLNQRFYSRISLANQIQDLERNVLTAVPSEFNVPLKLSSNVTQWQRISWQEYCQEYPNSEKLITAQLVANVDLVYRLVVQHRLAKLVAFVAIKNNYPMEQSLINVTIEWNGIAHSGNCDAVRDMERAVNSDWSTNLKFESKVWMLSAQIRRLVSCFDIFLEVTNQADFPQEKIYFSPVRGRNRQQPYKFLNTGGGVFTQY